MHTPLLVFILTTPGPCPNPQRASPAKKSPAVAATGKGIDKKEKQKEQKEKKEKKEPEKKPTLEDLDADLTSYQAARKGEEAAATDGA